MPANLPPPPENPPPRPGALFMALRLAIYYLVFGLVWIALTDWAVSVLPREAAGRLQTLKGFLFVGITSVFLLYVVLHYLRSLESKEHAMRERLEHDAAEYHRLFQRNPSAMLIFDPQTRQIFAANDVALILYGFPREKLLSMKTLDLVIEEERNRVVSTTVYQNDAVQSTGPWQIRRGDGRIIFVEALSHTVEFNGKPARIALINDVTERLENQRTLAQYRTQLEYRVTERTSELSQANRQLEEEIERRRTSQQQLMSARAAAEAANEAKSTLLAQTSHEIRTPLTSLLGYADLLSDESLTPDERERYLGLVTQNAQHMLALVDDLMDFSRAQTGHARITLAAHSVREIARQAVDLLHPRALQQNLALMLRVLEDVPDTLQTDGVRLRQILLNLMNNALKFTEAGSVSLTVSIPFHQNGSHPAIRFEVVDTGIGMNRDQLECIFDPFYQIDSPRGRRAGGLGLGLAISRQLARQLGGEITVASEPGRGTTFTLQLPLTVSSEKPRAATAPVAVPHERPAVPTLDAHILLAEDTPNIRLLVDEYLTRAGARVTAVADGAQAVAHVGDSLSAGSVRGQAFDLVLLDLHMPVLDGHQALEKMRAAGYSGPIVGLTAASADRSPAQWLAAGWTAVSPKPIDRQSFIPLLARLIAESRQVVSK